jgi:hypothetical protein
MERYWKQCGLSSKARKLLDRTPTKASLQMQRWFERESILHLEREKEAKEKGRRELRIMVKAFLVAQGIMEEKERLSNQKLLDYCAHKGLMNLVPKKATFEDT